MKRTKMITAAAILMLVLIGFSVGAQQSATSDFPPQVKDLLSKTRRSIKKASIEEMRKALEAQRHVVILYVRETEEFAAGPIRRALHIPRGKLEFHIVKEIPDPNTRIFV